MIKLFKNRRWLAMDITVLVVTVALVIVGVYFGTQKKPAATCEQPGRTHEIVLNKDAFSPSTLAITQCDILKIANLDTQSYHLAFGVHDQHLPYPGYTEQTLRPNEFFVVDALQAGLYTMHDHLRDKAKLQLDIRAKTN